MCGKDKAVLGMKENAPTLALRGHSLLLTLLPSCNPHIPSKVTLYLISLLPAIPTKRKRKRKKAKRKEKNFLRNCSQKIL